MSFAEKHYHHGVVKVTLDEGWAVEIEKLEYTPLVRLLSIPATEAAAPDEVLDELRGWNYRKMNRCLSGSQGETKRTGADVAAASGRNTGRQAGPAGPYRFFLSAGGRGSVEEEVLTAGLQEMNPLQIVKATFENSYQTEMPEDW